MIRKIFLCCLIILLGSTTAGLAQNITTMWPYKYSNFRTGTIYFKNQEPLSKQLNVHLLKSTLHYLDGDKIKEAQPDDIAFVLIDNTIQDISVPDKFYMYNGQLIRAISGDSTAFIAELILADFSAIKESGGAYGASSNTQSTRKLSSLTIGGVSTTSHMELKEKKDEGSSLPIIKKYFIVINGKVYPATRKDIESKLPADKKDAFKQFVKKNKINWKDPNSFPKLLEFLKS